ncbi:MAG: cysteine desulfurase [Patescibacteria group bacterium]|nr:cysteine desulfurase [Patescibacteria group bacterium]
MKKVYLDWAATTPVSQKIFQAMKPYFLKKYGNASQPHASGQEAQMALEESRNMVAKLLGAKPQEIIFTGSATESINLAHKGLVEALAKKFENQKPHIITSSIEHKAVLETCQHLERVGAAQVSYLPVDKNGLVKTEDIQKAITPQTVLVSVMYANNEVGTIEPIREIGLMLKKINRERQEKGLAQIFFHTDATQAISYLNCQADYLGVDLLSFTGHKLSAPKGVGALYVRTKIPLIRQIDGGGQEQRMRAGTENIPCIVGLAKAVEEIINTTPDQINKLQNLRDKLIEGVLKIPRVRSTGGISKRVPHIASFIFDGAEGESIVLLLSTYGIYVSSGSACTSDKLAPSHVLTAMGIPPEISHGSIRFSLGKDTTQKDIDYVLSILPKVIERLRKMAPKLGEEYHGSFL